MEILWVREPVFNASWDDLFERLPNIKVNNHSVLNFFLFTLPSYRNFYIPKVIDIVTKRNIRYKLYLNSFDKLKYSNHIYVNSYSQQGDLYPITKLFKPIAALQNKINFITNMFTSETIGIHIRTKDNVKAKTTSTLDKFNIQISKFLKEHKDAKFFLCSDSTEIKQQLIDKYGSAIITCNSALSRNSKRGIQDAVVELWALAATNEIWGSYYSSYSEMAASIHNKKLKIVE